MPYGWWKIIFCFCVFVNSKFQSMRKSFGHAGHSVQCTHWTHWTKQNFVRPKSPSNLKKSETMKMQNQGNLAPFHSHIILETVHAVLTTLIFPTWICVVTCVKMVRLKTRYWDIGHSGPVWKNDAPDLRHCTLIKSDSQMSFAQTEI